MPVEAPVRPPAARLARAFDGDRIGPPVAPVELEHHRGADLAAIVFWTCQALGVVILALSLLNPGWIV